MNLVNKFNELGLIEVVEALDVTFIRDYCNFLNFKLNLELQKPLGVF